VTFGCVTVNAFYSLFFFSGLNSVICVFVSAPVFRSLLTDIVLVNKLGGRISGFNALNVGTALRRSEVGDRARPKGVIGRQDR